MTGQRCDSIPDLCGEAADVGGGYGDAALLRGASEDAVLGEGAEGVGKQGEDLEMHRGINGVAILQVGILRSDYTKSDCRPGARARRGERRKVAGGA